MLPALVAVRGRKEDRAAGGNVRRSLRIYRFSVKIEDIDDGK
jgi:hypothetical protein